jgi:two-component system OmpR family sensor kinase
VNGGGGYDKGVAKPDGRARADLIALVAHDLRNPLAAIVANLSYVRSAIEDPGPEVDGALADAEMACTRIEKMTTNLTVMARACLPASPERRPTSLRDVTSAAVERARAAAQSSRVTMNLVDADVPHVLVDAELLGIALDNLLSNSIQYSPAGHSVAVELSASDGRASVTVVDDGPIVPESLRDVVVRVDGQTSARHRVEARYGLGLALYAASQAACLAGAALAVTEKAGRSAFEISAEVAYC